MPDRILPLWTAESADAQAEFWPTALWLLTGAPPHKILEFNGARLSLERLPEEWQESMELRAQEAIANGAEADNVFSTILYWAAVEGLPVHYSDDGYSAYGVVSDGA